MRDWAGAGWAATDDFARRGRELPVGDHASPGVAYCSMEYYRWAGVRSCGRKAAGSRSPSRGMRKCRCLGLHGADDPWLLAAHRRGVDAVGGGAAHTGGAGPGTGHFPHEERPALVTARISGLSSFEAPR